MNEEPCSITREQLVDLATRFGEAGLHTTTQRARFIEDVLSWWGLTYSGRYPDLSEYEAGLVLEALHVRTRAPR